MSAEIQVTADFQVAPVFRARKDAIPKFINPSAVDVYLDNDPTLLNSSPVGTVPTSGVKLAAGTLTPVQLFSSGDIYARAQSRTTIMVL